MDRQKSGSQLLMTRTTAVSGGLSLLFVCLYRQNHGDIWYTLAVTAVTLVFYHLAMRLAVGWAVKSKAGPRLKPESFWFRQRVWEEKLYQRLHIKHWKKWSPTYIVDNFNFKKHSAEEILRNMCTAELDHELNTVLSFLPLVISLGVDRLRSELWIFAVTGIVAGCFDMYFAVIQRYNRPRLIRLKSRMEKRKWK